MTTGPDDDDGLTEGERFCGITEAEKASYRELIAYMEADAAEFRTSLKWFEDRDAEFVASVREGDEANPDIWP